MIQCPRCGSGAEPDPGYSGVMRCLSCWEAWTMRAERHCPGTARGTFTPALRMLEEYRDLNR